MFKFPQSHPSFFSELVSTWARVVRHQPVSYQMQFKSQLLSRSQTLSIIYKKINQNYFQVSGIDCHDIEQEKYTSHITGPGEKIIIIIMI